MIEVLTEYGRLPTVEAKKDAIQALMTSLKGRQDSRPEKPAPPMTEKRDESQAPLPKSKRQTASPEAKKSAKRSASRTEKPRKSRPQQVEAKPLPGERLKARPMKLESAEPDPEGLAQSVTALKGVGAGMEPRLHKLGAESIWDLLYVFPHRYDDYTLMKPIKDLVYGEQVTVIGTIWETRARRIRNNQIMVQSVISDGTAKIQATWFNQKWLAEKLEAGMQIVLSGKVDQYLGRLVFNSPEWEPLELEPLRTRRLVPVYPLTKGLTSNKMRQIMRKAVSRWGARVPDPLPEEVRERREFYTLRDAIQQIHFPDSQETLHRARQRLIFDELFLLQLGMQGQRRDWQSQPGQPVSFDEASLIRLRNTLPFELTEAQNRVIIEIRDDMASDVPMNRLLQGDVGSGKTVVAAAAMLFTAKADMQAALMAPTEILAEQHFASLSKLLAPQNVEVRLLTGSTPSAEREIVNADLASGKLQVVIGTHALIQKTVEFKNLALAVIDEQHRFGVAQRQALRDKGPNTEQGNVTPHLLVMSATPIPRTLALSLYGDLDVSVLDEMPPGRQEIKTRWLRATERERAYGFVRRQVETGRQAYVICSLVEESDKIDAKAAVDEYDRLQNQVFPDLKLGLIHGRLKAEEKEATMRAFHDGDVQILVSTSVIEVGVDVPNSTVMVIEDANRFGLAQLHQFRGRVGRGQHQSYCLLVADHESADAEERLKALEMTNDGFVLAEKDLELRGPGEFFGQRQSGLPELHLASLLDMNMLEIAQAEAATVMEKDPLLEQAEHHWLRAHVARFWESANDVG